MSDSAHVVPAWYFRSVYAERHGVPGDRDFCKAVDEFDAFIATITADAWDAGAVAAFNDPHNGSDDEFWTRNPHRDANEEPEDIEWRVGGSNDVKNHWFLFAYTGRRSDIRYRGEGGRAVRHEEGYIVYPTKKAATEALKRVNAQ